MTKPALPAQKTKNDKQNAIKNLSQPASGSPTRRAFLRHTTSAVLAAPFILPATIRAAKGPNSLVNMAFIGMGKQNRGLLSNFLHRDIKVRAVCDVDTKRREHALNMVKKFHADHPGRGAADCLAYADFREIMARNDIDAVCIATPDHWHAIITLAALRSGKDVYCEKPLTHNIREAIVVMAEAKKHHRVLQTGSMQRSMSEFRVACELVRNGVIGKIKRVQCHFGGTPRPCDLPEQTMEAGLNWDRWLGPAPLRPYNAILSPRGIHNNYPQWRAFAEYGGSGNCDFGAHHLDIAHWALDMDDSGPIEICPPEKAGAKFGAKLTYDNGITVTTAQVPGAVFFDGTEGQVIVDRGSFKFMRGGETITNPQLAEKNLLANAKIRLYRSGSHTDDFLARVADRKRPVSSEVEGGYTAIACHLINLAVIHNQKLLWDPAKFCFKNGSGDPKWLECHYRKPWAL